MDNNKRNDENTGNDVDLLKKKNPLSGKVKR